MSFENNILQTPKHYVVHLKLIHYNSFTAQFLKNDI